MQFERGAHAPSRAVGGALADHTQAEDTPPLGDPPVSGPTGGGAGRNTRGRVCPPFATASFRLRVTVFIPSSHASGQTHLNRNVLGLLLKPRGFSLRKGSSETSPIHSPPPYSEPCI